MHSKSLQSCLTLCNPIDYRPPGSSVREDSPGKSGVGVGCHALLQGFFLPQRSNPRLLWLLCCRRILYCWVTGEEAHHHSSRSGSFPPNFILKYDESLFPSLSKLEEKSSTWLDTKILSQFKILSTKSILKSVESKTLCWRYRLISRKFKLSLETILRKRI